MKEHYGCPVQATINLMSGKWKVHILWHLSFWSCRFAELKRLLPGITEKVLTDQLRQLEGNKVLTRTATKDTPPKVFYTLSNAGRKLIPMMKDLCGWGSKHFGIEPTLRRSPQKAGQAVHPGIS
jgi:DNA-binding HxlR family transcriptional regulator